MTLAQFQDDFAHALRGDAGALPALARQPGFAVYRNTVAKARIDALEASFPSVHRLVGGEWFRAAAGLYVSERLPSSPSLLEYGGDFPAFLARFEPAAELPYLPGVATLDRCWTQAHIAADEDALDPASVAGLAADALGALRLRPHVSARWRYFEDLPVGTIWRRNRACDAADLGDVEWRGEGMLIVRPHMDVEAIGLDRGGCALLDACAGGATLGEAAAHALGVDPGADLAALMARLLRSRVFASIPDTSGGQ